MMLSLTDIQDFFGRVKIYDYVLIKASLSEKKRSDDGLMHQKIKSDVYSEGTCLLGTSDALSASSSSYSLDCDFVLTYQY